MNNIKIAFFAAFCSLIKLDAQTFAGYRDSTELPVLQISEYQLLSLAQQSFANFQNISISDVKLNDNPAVSDYSPSLIFTILFL